MTVVGGRDPEETRARTTLGHLRGRRSEDGSSACAHREARRREKLRRPPDSRARRDENAPRSQHTSPCVQSQG